MTCVKYFERTSSLHENSNLYGYVCYVRVHIKRDRRSQLLMLIVLLFFLKSRHFIILGNLAYYVVFIKSNQKYILFFKYAMTLTVRTT